MPLVTIVMPNFNSEQYLNRSVGSLLGQTLKDWELLVVDDGSRIDPEPYIPADVRIRVIRHRFNQGASAARNTGINNSESKYVAFFDSDDWWYPEKLEKQISLLERDGSLAICFCNYRHILPSGDIFSSGSRVLDQLADIPSKVDGSEVIWNESLHLALIRLTSFMHTSSIIVRRSVLDRTGGFDLQYKTAEDLDLWVRITRLGLAGYVSDVLVDVLKRPDSLGHQFEVMTDNLLRLYSNYYETNDLDPLTRAIVKRRLITYVRDKAWLDAKAGEFADAISGYRSSRALSGSMKDEWAIIKTRVKQFLHGGVQFFAPARRK